MNTKPLILILIFFIVPNLTQATCDPNKANCKAAIDFFGRLLNGAIAKSNCSTRDIKCKKTHFLRDLQPKHI